MSAVNPGGGGGGGGDLQTTLALGNFTGGNDIELTSGDVLTSVAVGVTANGLTTTVIGGPGGSTSGDGGNVDIFGGVSSDGVGGTVNINGADGSGTNRDGGDVLVRGGNASGNGLGGELDFIGGAGGPLGDGGGLLFTGGAGGATSGNAGSVVIQGGTTTNGTGGNVSILATAAAGTGTDGGDVIVQSGQENGGDPGRVVIRVQSGDTFDAAVFDYDLTNSVPIVYGLQRHVIANTTTPISINADTSRWTIQTNEGAGAEVVFELPPAVVGLQYTFVVENANGVQIDADAGDSLQISTAAAGTSVESTDVGSVLTLLAINSTTWVAISVVGTWTVT